MDLDKLAVIIRRKTCPICSLGAVVETRSRVYMCDRVECGEIFDFSPLSDELLNVLLDRGDRMKKEHGIGPSA